MRIGIMGTGMVGQAIAGRLAELDHEMLLGTRDPATTLAREAPDGYGNPPFKVWHTQHPDVKLGSFADAAAHGELVVNATAGAASVDALRLAGEANLDGKVLVDIANALDFSRGMQRGRHAPDMGSRTRFPDFRALWIVTVPWPRLEVAEFLVGHSVEFGEELDDLVVALAIIDRNVVAGTVAHRPPR